MSDRRYQTGLMGEQAVEAFLTSQGFAILSRRFRYGRGEIDLVCRDGDYIVFVEVKTRPHGKAGDGLAAVTPDKQRRMLDAASGWLMQNQAFDAPVRFDAV